VLQDVALGQATAWCARPSSAAVYLVVAGVMLALAGMPFAPLAVVLARALSAPRSARTPKVTGHRYVCETDLGRPAARARYLHLLRGEAGCRMRSEALLRYADASGAPHEAAAVDPYDDFAVPGPDASAQTPTRSSASCRWCGRVPGRARRALASPRTVLDDGAQADDMATGSLVAGTSARRSSSAATIRCCSRPWRGSARRRDARAPALRPRRSRARLARRLFDQPASQRVPMARRLVLVPVATWSSWSVVGLLHHGLAARDRYRDHGAGGAAPRRSGRRTSSAWSNYFSADGEGRANLREDFERARRRTDLRTEPEDEAKRCAS
jgi:hypothetical protein